ncbi:MAG TPA: YeeE/YedE thiosulfate transporter family protein [Gemmatimonadales bacterium]|nr:YeeE/YedE thiosulfate transporter family protein [Gemmatimonadales bacterium]
MGDFTPVSGLIGGLLIGLAVALMLLLNGRIAGVSGSVGGLVNPKAGDTGWRAAFVVGLPLGALAYILLAGGSTPVDVLASPPAILIGGLLVGFGTRMGSGCTSGHGLCGLSLLSRRSVVATAVFFGVAMVTVFLTGHVF